MRVRLQSLPPLPPLKAWYEIPAPLLSDSSTIEQLKDDICYRFLKQQATGELVFEVESYEILNDCTVTVLRENDLIVIKYRPTPVAGSKRKRTIPSSSPAPTKTTKTRSLSISSSSSNSSSSSSSSAPSSSTSSSSASSTSTSSSLRSRSAMGNFQSILTKSGHSVLKGLDSDISASAVNSMLFGVENSKTQTFKPLTGGIQLEAISENTVPPGHGKSSTQKRNLRRKKKRLAEKGLDDGDNSSPLAASADGGFKEDSLSASMYKLKNENKRKGFKKDVQNSISSHQVFASTQDSSPQKRVGQFIPPSQQKNLPRNIFVTSVDVEAGEWELGSMSLANQTIAAEISADFAPTQRALPDSVSSVIHWETLDQNWGDYPIAKRDHLKVGKIFLWKDLTLNPVTLTPEVSVQAGKVLLVGEKEFTIEVFRKDEAEIMESETEFTKNFLELENFRLYS